MSKNRDIKLVIPRSFTEYLALTRDQKERLWKHDQLLAQTRTKNERENNDRNKS